MKILLTAVNAKYIHSNLAVYSLRAYAEEFAEHIELAEFTINQKTESILQEIYKRKPEVLCFSCYIWNISVVEEIAEEFHKLRPDVPIWVGGPEVSYEAEAFLAKHPYIKGVMMGEGEKIFSNLCRHYLGRQTEIDAIGDSREAAKQECDEVEMDLSRTPGIAYRTSTGIRVNAPETVLDMSDIPFAYQKMEDFEHKIIYYESSRGCPFRCSYCLSSVEKKLRFRDMELVRRELEFFIEHEVPQVKFVDRTFNCDSAHALEIWRFIKEKDKGNTNFHFEVAADLMTEEELDFIATLRPGLIQLEIGVQTTNPATIEEIHRRMDLDKVKQVVRRIQEGKNIHQHLDLIAGLPYEDYQTFGKSFDEIYALKPEQLQLGFLKVLKGSYMYGHQEEYEIVHTSRPPYEVMQTKWLTYEDVQSIKRVEEMLEVYYNSGQYQKSIRLLEEAFDSAFDMFRNLGEYYERKGYFLLNHTRNRRMEILLEFAEEILITGRRQGGAGQEDALPEPETTAQTKKECMRKAAQINMERIREAAVYDIYARENAKTRPVFAEDLQEWKQLSRKYCKKGKLSHLERFWYEEDGRKREKPYYILFDYQDRSPLNHQAIAAKIEETEE